MKKNCMENILKELDLKDNEVFEIKSGLGWVKYCFSRSLEGFLSLKEWGYGDKFYPCILIALLNGDLEYRKFPKYSQEEQDIRNALKKIGFKYVAKDKDDAVYVFTNKPIKRTNTWVCDGSYLSYNKLNNIELSNVSWEDAEPQEI